jgi:hypothetical protein
MDLLRMNPVADLAHALPSTGVQAGGAQDAPFGWIKDAVLEILTQIELAAKGPQQLYPLM